jgi:transposase
MALIRVQGLSLASLAGKTLNEISKLVDFTINIEKNTYKDKYFHPDNIIEINDNRLTKFNSRLSTKTKIEPKGQFHQQQVHYKQVPQGQMHHQGVPQEPIHYRQVNQGSYQHQQATQGQFNYHGVPQGPYHPQQASQGQLNYHGVPQSPYQPQQASQGQLNYHGVPQSQAPQGPYQPQQASQGQFNYHGVPQGDINFHGVPQGPYQQDQRPRPKWLEPETAPERSQAPNSSQAPSTDQAPSSDQSARGRFHQDLDDYSFISQQSTERPYKANVLPWSPEANPVNQAVLNFLKNKYTNTSQHYSRTNLNIRSYGTQLLLETISNDIKLTQTLQEIFPDFWTEILTLSFYLISENNYLRYCSDWLEHVNGMLSGTELTINKIEKVLTYITEDKRLKFFAKWAETLGDTDYIAYNIDSVISDNSSIDNIFLDYGKLDLESTQVNLAVILGEKSRLPISTYAYNGQPADAASFFANVAPIDYLNPSSTLSYAFDKSFYTTSNLNEIINNSKNNDFLIQIPLNNELSDFLIRQCSNNIYIENYNFRNNKILFSFCIDVKWEDSHDLKIYIFLDEKSSLIAEKDLYQELFMFKTDAESIEKQHTAIENTNFFHLNDSDLLASLELKHKNVINKYKNSGWFLVLSNRNTDLSYILDTYYLKQFINKYVTTNKNNLNIYNLYTNTNSYNNKKIFIGFISLILHIHMQNILYKNSLDKNTTVNKMIKDFNMLKSVVTDDKIMYSRLSPHHKAIFRAFNIGID